MTGISEQCFLAPRVSHAVIGHGWLNFFSNLVSQNKIECLRKTVRNKENENTLFLRLTP